MSAGRVTREYVEAVVHDGDPEGRITREYVEVVVVAVPPPGRITNIYVEVLIRQSRSYWGIKNR